MERLRWRTQETQQQMFMHLLWRRRQLSFGKGKPQRWKENACSSLLLPQLAVNNWTNPFYLDCVRMLSWRVADKNNVASFAHGCQHRSSKWKKNWTEWRVPKKARFMEPLLPLYRSISLQLRVCVCVCVCFSLNTCTVQSIGETRSYWWHHKYNICWSERYTNGIL